MFTLFPLKNRAAVIVAALAISLASSALHAQNIPERTQVTVPFGFEVGSAHLGPGRYVLSNQGENIIIIQDRKHSALTMSSHETSPDPASSSKVIFHRYGNHYFLREIWRKGEKDHVRCFESKAEQRVRREMRGDYRASVSTHTDVEVALLDLPR
ncbi:MAG: hypothetical protein WBY53_18700 [Acidobacteriaceae bacterium]